MTFPIDVSGYKPLKLDPANATLSPDQLEQLKKNIQIVRDSIVFFTAVAGVKGLAGHTGGAYSMVPEVLIADGFMKHSDKFVPIFFDEGGHRVAIQYAMAASNGELPFEKLLHYREANHGLYGHPERDEALGIKFSSGRLGHMWPFVNGVALADRDKVVFMFGSDGSQQEGNDAEAARLAVAQKLNVKVIVDDNNVTISGHPSNYLPGYDVSKTLTGHGLTVDTGDGEDIAGLYARMQKAVTTAGPIAVVNKRPMAPGIPGIEGSHAGHEVVKKEFAVDYLTKHGQTAAVEFLNGIQVPKSSTVYLGSSKETFSNRSEFGAIVNGILAKLSEKERKESVLVIDSDLEGSTGLNVIRKAYPEVCINGGVQERGNFSAAAGFGFTKGKQGIFSTFSAFLEMIVSEATMARLNEANAICHFSHAGVDEIADNTCHYGINLFFANSGLEESDHTRLYFAADALQLKAIVEEIWEDPGLRFVFTTRSKTPIIQRGNGIKFFSDENNYKFVPGKDEVIRSGSRGYVVSYGEMLYRALDAVERARGLGIDVGLINKPTLNLADEVTLDLIGQTHFVLCVEGQNRQTGLGVRFGSWLLEHGHTPNYDYMGVVRPGKGGIPEHIEHQGLSPEHILDKIMKMNK